MHIKNTREMKQLITILFFTILSNGIWCQTNTIPPKNNTIIRLTILNDAGEMLIRDTKYGWMTPATYHNKRQNINEVIDSLILNYGIEISEPNLAGIFTYKYEFKPSADIRILYVARLTAGELISESGEEKLYWMSQKEAIEKLQTTVPSLGEMTNQILDYPQIIWGGSYTLFRDNDNNLKSKVTEPFFPLNGN